MNYFNIYERIRVQINAEQTFTEADKILIKAIMLECCANEMSAQYIVELKERDNISAKISETVAQLELINKQIQINGT